MDIRPHRFRRILLWATFCIGLLVLIGWYFDIAVLKSVVPSVTPMNPVTASCFVLISLSLLLKRRIAWLPYAAGAAIAAVGGIMLLKYLGVADLHIDRILFTSRLTINRMAPTTAANLLLVGLSVITLKRGRAFVQIASVLVLAVSGFSLIAYLYNFVGVYGQTLYNPMALHTAVVFILLSVYLLSETEVLRGKGGRFILSRGLGPASVAVLVFICSMIIMGSVAFLLDRNNQSQSANEFKSQSAQIQAFMQSRMNLYVYIVYGLQGLFNASESVEQDEWDRYIQQLDISNHYTGVSAVSYIEKVSRQDPGSFPYAIFPSSTEPYAYSLRYATNFTTPAPPLPFGFDYTTEPIRDATLMKAIRTGVPASTPQVKSITVQKYLFSVYGPIYQNGAPHDTAAERTNNASGFAAVSFFLSDIAPDIFSNSVFTPTVDAEVYDAGPGQSQKPVLLFSTDNGYRGKPDSTLVATSTIQVADRTWIIRTYSRPGANLQGIQGAAPLAALIGGGLLSLLFALLALAYMRVREQAVIGKNIQIETLVQNYPSGVFIEDAAGDIALVNQKMLDIAGLSGTPTEYLGCPATTITDAFRAHVKDFDAFAARMQEIRAAGVVVADETLSLTSEEYLSRSYIPLAYLHESQGSVWIYKDVSEEEKVSHMKSDFVSLVSHQLKTPVAQIKGYVDNLLDGLAGPITAKEEDYLHDMLSVANKNSRLIDDLLNVSRIERGVLKIEKAPLSANTLIETAVSPLRAVAAAKGVQLTDQKLAEDVMLSVDVVKIPEALRNIIDNAVKFTDAGKSVAVSARADGKSVSISIADQGPGVDPQVQTELFEKNRVWSGKVKASGAGLGLYLSKRFIELMGGFITFTTKPGEGTTFVITLPET